MDEIGCGANFLYGYVHNEKYTISLTPEQISAFIMKYQLEELTITNILDKVVITTVIGGFIMFCSDQTFLREKLIPVLSKMQMGEVEPPEFVPLNDEDE